MADLEERERSDAVEEAVTHALRVVGPPEGRYETVGSPAAAD